MANIYVRSTDGSNADNGSTWALAKATLVGASAIDAAGDTIYISQSHAESSASTQTIPLAGTATSITRVLCGDDGAEPPTSIATSATVTTTSNAGISFSTGYIYVYGIGFSVGSTTNSAIFVSQANSSTFESCSFVHGGTGTSSRFTFGVNGAITTHVLKNCTFKFNAVGGMLSLGTVDLQVVGGSILSGSAAVTSFITFSAAPGPFSDVRFVGFDMSNLGASTNLVQGGGSSNCKVKFINCKLPSSWSGSLTASSPSDAGSIYEMYNCDSGDTNYRYRKTVSAGTIQDETTLVRTGGASDGTTTYSIKLVTNANSIVTNTLDTYEMVKWNDTTGSAITATVEILHDSATALKDDEIWLEVDYLGTSGYPLGSRISDAKADVLATAADQTSSSETWTTTGMSNPNKQKLSVTFTPQEKGFIHAVVRMAKASKTVYVDPKITVT